MVARASILMMAAVIGLGLPIGSVAFAKGDVNSATEAVLKRDDDDRAVTMADDDGDDDTRSRSRSRTGRSRDRTNSRHTSVSRNRDRSRGDLTRDKTRDGKGGKKRDWSRHHTNDRSRNDTR